MRICAMNTHMSFKKSTAVRVAKMQGAWSEAQNANCHAIVFVGDFNSRFYCVAPDDKNTKPPVDRTDGGSTFQYILYNVCDKKSTKCNMKGRPSEHWDELHNMLTENTMHCFSK